MEREELIAKSLAMVEKLRENRLSKSYVGFDKLKSKLAHRKGKKKAKNPGALAAWIGMKKYGKKKFEAAAHSGKKLKKDVPTAMLSQDSGY